MLVWERFKRIYLTQQPGPEAAVFVTKKERPYANKKMLSRVRANGFYILTREGR